MREARKRYRWVGVPVVECRCTACMEKGMVRAGKTAWSLHGGRNACLDQRLLVNDSMCEQGHGEAMLILSQELPATHGSSQGTAAHSQGHRIGPGVPACVRRGAWGECGPENSVVAGVQFL
jgi:hypothetical protein